MIIAQVVIFLESKQVKEVQKVFLRILVVSFFLLAAIPMAIAGDKWWMPADGQDAGSVWAYRIPITVAASGEIDYADYPIEVPVDFNLLLSNLKGKGTLDLPNSLRLICQDGLREVPVQYDDNRYKDEADETGNGRGTVVFVLGNKDTSSVLKAGSSIKYYLYFDIIENGLKKTPSYVPIKAMILPGSIGRVDTGKIGANIGLGGGKYRNGIKEISLSDGDIKIKIPLYRFGIDSLGREEAPLAVELEKGAVTARFYFHQETNNPDKDIKQSGEPPLEGCFTFFNNSGVYYLDMFSTGGKKFSLANFMGGGFFTSFQDNTMSAPMALTKDAVYRNAGARYGVAISEKVGFATLMPEKATLVWDTRKYDILPSFFSSSSSYRVKHSLARGGIEMGKALDVLPSVFINPTQAESTKK